MVRHGALGKATAALLITLTLGGCSGGGSNGASGKPSSAASSEAERGEELAVGPLDEYVGVGAGVATTSDDADYRAFEEAIARCMAAEGFEYVPYVAPFDSTVLPDGTITLEPSKPSFPDLPPDEFAARFGYGISTKPPAAREEEKDPNEAIVARMSVAERVAYQQALRGTDNVLDDQGYPAGPGLSSTDDSCIGRADAQSATAEETARAEKRIARVRDSFATLLERVRGLRDDELDDPRVVAATETWSRCLAAAGHPGFTELDQPRAQALDEARRLLGQDLLGASQADPSRLATLRKAEVELAVADEQCLRDWRTTFRAVQQDLEEQFVRENLAELEEFRSAMSAAVAELD